jgi:hypothetical protein
LRFIKGLPKQPKMLNVLLAELKILRGRLAPLAVAEQAAVQAVMQVEVPVLREDIAAGLAEVNLKAGCL